jgi:hypothetical protein
LKDDDMGCCGAAGFAAVATAGLAHREEMAAALRRSDGRPGRARCRDVRCRQRMATIPSARHKLHGVASTRVVRGMQQVSVRRNAQDTHPVPLVQTIETLNRSAAAVTTGR